MVKRIAERDGVTEDEAATRLVKEALARRVKKRTGRAPAKVYSIKGGGGSDHLQQTHLPTERP